MIHHGQGLALGLCCLHQRQADLHAEVIGAGFLLGQGQKEAAPGAADVEMEGLAGPGE